MRKAYLAIVVVTLAPVLLPIAFADEPAPSNDHHQAVASVLISMIVILIAAKLGGELFERIRQPAVLGELIAGMVIGNLNLVGFHGLDFLRTEEVIAILAEIGVIFLLFEVGLESNLKEMMAVGLSSLLVATAGVIAPMVLGWGVAAWFLPHEGTLVHVFIGATLTATSVGITARVLRDLGKVTTKEAKIILGAAVIDDVLGLLVLAVVSGMILAANQGGTGLSLASIAWILAKAVIFLAGSLIAGLYASPRLFGLASKLRVHGMLLVTSIAFCFLLAYLAGAIGLAPIVGAFAAGLILDEVHYKDFVDRGEHTIEEMLQPITTFLVPIFFVLMGIRVDLSTFGHLNILGFAAVLTLVAIIGKQVCGLAVAERGLNRLAVGLGMIPRGEVGLIFAGIGMTLRLNGEQVVSVPTFSAVVIMVIVTTLVTPPVLKWALTRPS
jgi:Kef-type K+ transport system membrane component KefB